MPKGGTVKYNGALIKEERQLRMVQEHVEVEFELEVEEDEAAVEQAARR